MGIQVLKAFQVAKMKTFIDGEPLSYQMDIKLPGLVCPTETFNNTSTGGEIEIANGFRWNPDGDGEIKFETDHGSFMSKVMNPTNFVQLNVAIAQNTLQPQIGFVPMPVNYRIGCQFFGVDFGTVTQDKKREITAKFKMLTLKFEYANQTILDFDSVNGMFEVNGADLVTAVTSLLG